MYIKNKVEGNKTEFIAESSADIATLPTTTTEGTGGKSEGDDGIVAFGSTCIVLTGSSTDVYMLGPNNTWVIM
jgi:hypothetical protein